MHKQRFFLSEVNSLDENKDYELIHTGKNTDPRYGDFQFSKQDLDELANNFNTNVRGIEIAVDVNHHPEKLAYAWIKPGSMFVSQSTNPENGYSLFAKLYKFTPKGEELVKTGALRYFSLQIKHDYEYFADSVKRIAKNVIVGLALTNSPVIKGLAPTYAEQQTSTIYSLSMEMFQAFLDYLSAKETVSAEEKQALQKMLGLLSPEEQSSVQDVVTGIMQLPEQAEMATKPADASAQDQVAPATPVEGEAPVEGAGKAGAAKKKKTPPTAMAEGEEGEVEKEVPAEVAEKPAEGEASAEVVVEDKELAEKDAQIKTLAEERDQLLAERREKSLSETVDSMILSEKNKVGFVATQRDGLKAFVSTLGEEQVKQFSKLVGELKSVDLSERGASGQAKSFDVMQLAEQIMKDESCSKSVALEKAYKKAGVWGKQD